MKYGFSSWVRTFVNSPVAAAFLTVSFRALTTNSSLPVSGKR
jgi:hypothetical protein